MKNYLTITNTLDTNINELISKTLDWRDYGVLYTQDNGIVQYANNEYSYDTSYLISMIDVEWSKNWYQHNANKLYDYVSGIEISSNMSDYSSRIYDKYIQLDKNCYLEQYNKPVFEAINNNSFTMEIIFNLTGKSGSNSTIFALGQDSPRNRILWSWGGGDDVTGVAYKQTGTSNTAVTAPTRNTIFKIVITIDLSGTATYYAYNLQTNTLTQTKTLTKGTATLNPETNNIININKLPNYATSQYSSNMKLYSLRFYNKCLSTEEINKHNTLDISRFVSYITDGLIFWLDGINKGSSDNSWKDLIGGIVFTGTNVTSTEYGWSFDGSSSYFLSDSTLTGTADYTVEVCFKPNNTNTYCLFICNKNTQNNVLFYKSGNNITFSQYNNTYPLTLSANQKYSVSLNIDNGLLNGASVSKNSGTDYWTGTNNFYIGRRSAGSYFNGEIYSIRIYNRKLSQSEQLANFNMDNNRFNLGL